MPDIGSTKQAATKPTGTNAKRWFVHMLIVGLVLVAIGVSVCAYIGISTSVHAEKAIHAVNAASVIVDCYVRQEHRWPTSWDDLQAVGTVDSPLPLYSWPDDVHILQQFVTIDFNANLETIAVQSVDDFHAIEPIGACYPYKDYGFIDALIRDVRVLVDRQDSPEVLPPATRRQRRTIPE